MPKISISLPADMNEKIEDDLEYGDSKSEWIRQGIRYRLAVDDCVSEDLSADKKVALVKEALREHADSQ